MSAALRTGPLADLAALVARVVLGVVFIAHGYQKLAVFGLAGATEAFRGMGVPAPEPTAPAISVIELVGGIALILGAFTGIAGVALALEMLVAALLVHVPAGIYIENGGWELVGALGAGALLVAAFGAGRFSVDSVLRGRRGARSAAAAERPAAEREPVSA